MRYRPAPAATPSAAIAHTSAAVVKPNTRSFARIKAPAPRKPMPVMTPPRRVNGLSASKSIARIARAAAPVDTKMNVPNPTGLRRICRSRPIPKARAKTSRSRKTLSAGSIVTLRSRPDGTSHRASDGACRYFSVFSKRASCRQTMTNRSIGALRGSEGTDSRMRGRRLNHREFHRRWLRQVQPSHRALLEDLRVRQVFDRPRREGRGDGHRLLPAVQEVAVVRHPRGQDLTRIHERLRRIVLVPRALDVARGHPQSALVAVRRLQVRHQVRVDQVDRLLLEDAARIPQETVRVDDDRRGLASVVPGDPVEVAVRRDDDARVFLLQFEPDLRH